MVDLLCSGPSRSFGLDYGTLKVGRDADLIVVNPSRAWTFSTEEIRSKSKNSPFVGRTLTGQVTHTFVGGRQVVADGRLISEMGERDADKFTVTDESILYEERSTTDRGA